MLMGATIYRVINNAGPSSVDVAWPSTANTLLTSFMSDDDFCSSFTPE